MKILTIIVLTAGILLFAGCKKKTSEQPQAPTPQATTESKTQDLKQTATETQQAVQQTAQQAAETAKEAVKAMTADIDLTSTVEKLKEQAQQMTVESLKETALKYKDKILSSQTDLKTNADKLAAIPMAEKLGAEAQAITKEIKSLTETVSALKERFNMYLDVIKAKAGDTKDLVLPQ